MLTAAIMGPQRIGLVEREEPELPGEGWAVVKIHAAPMCAEYKAFVQGEPCVGLGHEAAGEVVRVSAGSRVKVGDRVVVMPQYPCGQCGLCLAGDYVHCEHNLNYGAPTITQYIAKPSWLLPAIPDDVSYVKASMACCGLGASFGAMEKLGVDAFSTVLITGLGPVGLGAVVNAKFRGAEIIAVESNAHRIALAREMGVTHIVDPRGPDAVAQIKRLTGGKGPDCGIDASGAVAAHRLQIDAIARGGRIAFVGECGDDTPIRISPDLIRKGISLIGSWHYNLNAFPRLMDVIRRSPLVDRLITHVYPMSRIQEAFETSASQQCAKIVLQPWE
ncbi:zinc-binding dehydrogenase [Cohnella sp. GCM10027633]|uniref:zinc-dependent alcohol dehydrogenase n=1 Tax=unclassified Cohnella TaxID=2636738 RepID=UPI00363F0AE1